MLWRASGEGRARAGGLRAGPASPRGGKAGGRAPGLLLLLAPSLRRWVQSVSRQPAGPRAAQGPSLGRRRLLLPLFLWLKRRRRTREPGPRELPRDHDDREEFSCRD